MKSNKHSLQNHWVLKIQLILLQSLHTAMETKKIVIMMMVATPRQKKN